MVTTMVENNDNDAQENEPSFAELLEAYDGGSGDALQVGDKVSVRVIAVGKESVFVDTGTKIDGTVERTELLDDDGNLTCEVGDTLDLFVVAREEGEIRLSKALSGFGGLQMLQEAHDGQIPVEGKVQATCKGGFDIRLLQQRAFCPISQIDIRYVETPEDYVGQSFSFLVTQFEERGRNIVVSRRRLLEKEREASREAFMADLKADALCEGRVVRVVPFGAFVELAPGVEGLVHVSELSWSRVADAGDVVREGDRLTVKVLEIKSAEPNKAPRIALSLKQVGDNPWEADIERFKAGDIVPAKITRCVPFGAFAEVAPGIEGLIHISEFSFIQRVRKPDDIVAPGETVSVMIKSVDREHRKLALSLRDVGGDPWQSLPDKYSRGQAVEGTVEKKAPFGLFVTIEPGVTGLFPKARWGDAADPGRLENAKPGDRLPVVIEAIDLDQRRISLGPGERADGGGNWQAYANAGNSSMGSLADKLQAALNAKKKP
jgi:small subunit ribosomal protein S1